MSELEDAAQQTTFIGFLGLIGQMAMVHMGAVPGPDGESLPCDPAIAQVYIEGLTRIREKTRGNLDAEETRQLDALLYSLRMAYVECPKKQE